jgi:2-amino-4-hydroxy-6-hydroxymethyldihydropteridine diphosphokinase
VSGHAATDVVLPPWAVVSDARRQHIARVTALLDSWTATMQLGAAERAAWHDAGAWHDALRDAPPDTLGSPAIDPAFPRGAWHGPAAAERLRAEGEMREDVLAAIAWHTVGDAGWAATGRALYCADFLEPGRSFLRAERSTLAREFPEAPAAVLRSVVQMRLNLALREHAAIHPRTIALWNSVI